MNFDALSTPHDAFCEICSTNMKWDTHEKQISCINSVILEPLMLPEKLRHTASAIGQLDEILSENCGEDISDKEKIVYVSLKIMEEVNVDRKKLSRKTMIFQCHRQNQYHRRPWKLKDRTVMLKIIV